MTNDLIRLMAEALRNYMRVPTSERDGYEQVDRAKAALAAADPYLAGDVEPTDAPTLERWGRGPEGTPGLLQRLPDGYWTPWHIAEQSLREATDNRDRAMRLLHLAMAQLRRWGDAYGTHNPPWLPPAGDVRLAEDADEFLAAHPRLEARTEEGKAVTTAENLIREALSEEGLCRSVNPQEAFNTSVGTITELLAEIDRLRLLSTCGCGDGFTNADPGACVNCLASADRTSEIDGLRSAVEAERADAERWRAMRECYDGFDWAYGSPPRSVATFFMHADDVASGPIGADAIADAAIRARAPSTTEGG